MGARYQAGVQLRPDSKNAQPRFRMGGQGVVNGFDKGRQVVGGIVIDEQNFVVGSESTSAMQFRLMAARFGRL